MAARDVLKNFVIFVDGRGYAGQAPELNLPDLAIQVEDFRAGGMDAPVALDMGQEAMEASFQLAAYDSAALSLWGVGPGRSVPLTARGALESYGGSTKQVLVNMRGIITTVSAGAWQAGQLAPLTITMRLDYFKQTIAGVVLHEIDVVNMIRIVGGVDRLAQQRAALGM